MSDAYQQFLARKRMLDPATGMTDIAPLPAIALEIAEGREG